MAVRVEIDLSPAFHKAFPSRAFTLEIPDEKASLWNLLRHLGSKAGSEGERLLFRKGKEEILPGLMVMVNDRTFSGVELNGKDVLLRDGDRINLLYFVSGG